MQTVRVSMKRWLLKLGVNMHVFPQSHNFIIKCVSDILTDECSGACYATFFTILRRTGVCRGELTGHSRNNTLHLMAMSLGRQQKVTSRVE